MQPQDQPLNATVSKLRAEVDAILSFFGGLDGLAARQVDFELLRRDVAEMKPKLLPEVKVKLNFEVLSQ